MEQYIKNFITEFAEKKGISVEQLISIELGGKIKYVYAEENSVHLVEELIQHGDTSTTSE